MLVLFGEGVLKDVCAVEVKPMDIGEGKIVGTQINFTLTSGDRLEYIYDQNIPIENAQALSHTLFYPESILQIQLTPI